MLVSLSNVNTSIPDSFIPDRRYSQICECKVSFTPVHVPNYSSPHSSSGIFSSPAVVLSQQYLTVCSFLFFLTTTVVEASDFMMRL